MPYHSQRIKSYPVNSIYPKTYIEIIERRHGSSKAIRDEFDLSKNELNQPNFTIPMEKHINLLTYILSEYGNHGIGIEVGLTLPPTAYGNVGYGILCSRNGEEAIDIFLRFWELLNHNIVDIEYSIESNWCSLKIDLKYDFLEPLSHVFLDSVLAALYRSTQLLANPNHNRLEFLFSRPRLDYSDFVSDRLPNVKFDMPSTQFRFRKNLLDLNLPMYNHQGLQQAIGSCEKDHCHTINSSQYLSPLILKELEASNQGYPSMEIFSERFNITTRTLRRRLNDEGTSYRSILNNFRKNKASELLIDHSNSIECIANILGYHDPANFARAFKQWTGVPPTQYRLLHKIK